MAGNLLIAHGGGPTAVMNAALYGVVRSAMQARGVGEIIGARRGIAGVLHEKLVDLRRQPQAVIDALPGIPSSVLHSCRHKVQPEEYERIVAIFRKYDIRYFIYQGGNDSMDTALQLSRLGQRGPHHFGVIGLPKTVDNDLPHTDHCPGFGSAARFYAQVALDMDADNTALPSPIAILEVMGRNAGWLTAACALGQSRPDVGPHLVYVPERAFDEPAFIEEVRAVHGRLGRALVAVSEGVRRPDGTPLYVSDRDVDRDAFGHPLPGNVGKYLADILSERAGLRARNLKPDLWGRACALLQSPVDREESVALGREAVRRLLDGVTGVMLTLERTAQKPYECAVGQVELERVANIERPLPPEFLTPDGCCVTPAFRDYALPLIGEPIVPYPRLDELAPRAMGDSAARQAEAGG